MLLHGLDRRPAGHSPLLVLTDPLDYHRHRACEQLLVDDGGSVLVFAYHRRPRVVVERLRESSAELPSITVVSLGEGTVPDPTPDFGPDVSVEYCGAANLTDVGVVVSRTLKHHSDCPLGVCLGSLTTLLQYVPLETAFKFLHVVLARLETTEGVVHAHLDPEAVDPEAVATLNSLFETSIERTEDGWAATAP